ncbi:rCG23778, partial [Rattus norvegicus]
MCDLLRTWWYLCCVLAKNACLGGWGFSSVVERLPRKRKALGSVPSS